MRWRSAVFAFVLLVTLAGCATPAPVAESATPTPRPTSSPTPVVLDVPLARVPGDCAALLPADALAAFGAGWELARDGAAAPQTALQTARRQAGVADCEWAGADGAKLNFLVVPDAQSDELNYAIRHLFDEGVIHDPVGADSMFICEPSGCAFSLKVADDFWLAGAAQTVDPAYASAALVPLLEGLVARIESALAAPNLEWVNPPAVHPGWGRTCGDAGLVEGIARLAREPGLAEAEVRFGDHDQVVVERVDPAYCRLVDPADPATEVLLAVVPGGAWALQELAATPGAFEAVEVDGLGTVLVTGDASRYTALVALQGSLVQVGMPATRRATFLDVLPDVVELIRRTPYTAPTED